MAVQVLGTSLVMIEQRVKRGRKSKIAGNSRTKVAGAWRSVGRLRARRIIYSLSRRFLWMASVIATALPLAMRVRRNHSQKLGPMRLSMARVFIANAASAGVRGVQQGRGPKKEEEFKREER